MGRRIGAPRDPKRALQCDASHGHVLAGRRRQSDGAHAASARPIGIERVEVGDGGWKEIAEP